MRIFLSAVSAQFRQCRDQLASDLRASDIDVKVQEDFPDGGGTLLQKLEELVESCDYVVALVGDAYGYEPGAAARPGGKRRSYTQWEYYFATGERLDGSRGKQKQVLVYFASAGYLEKHPVEQGKAETQLQKKFRDGILRYDKDRRDFDTADDLRIRVLRSVKIDRDDAVLKEVALLNFDAQHKAFEAVDEPSSIFLVYGKPHHGQRWLAQNLIRHRLMSPDGRSKMVDITLPSDVRSAVHACAESINIRREEIYAKEPEEVLPDVVKRLHEWLKHSQVIILLEGFPPNDIIETLCAPVFESLQPHKDLYSLSIFVLSTELKEPSCIKNCQGLRIFPELTVITHKQVTDWYTQTKRTRSKAVSRPWLEKVSGNRGFYMKVTHKGVPEFVLTNICSDFGVPYSDVVH